MRKSLVPALLLTVVVLLVFWPSRGASFLLWDDNINTYRNPWYQPLTWSNTLRFWLHPYNSTYRPLVHLAWAALCWLSLQGAPQTIPGGGQTFFDAGVFHDANLLLHVVNVLLVWRLACRFTPNPWAAAGGTLLFAIHPVQVESVCWVTGFNELLCATLCLLSLTCYLNWLGDPAGPATAADAIKEGRGPKPHPGNWKWHAASAGWFALALLVKPAAVALPLVLWSFQALIYRHTRARTMRALGPWLVAGAIWSAVTALAHPAEHAGMENPLWTRPLVAGDALAFYASKLLAPWPLGIDYGRTPWAVLATGWIWLEGLVPLGLGWWVWRLHRGARGPNATWPLLVYWGVVAWLLPVCGLKPFHFQLVYSTVADRYLYFALVPAAMGVARALDTARWRVALPLYAALALIWGTLSFVQAGTWQNNYSVFEHASRVNPGSWMAHANLGSAYDTDGNKSAAKTEFLAALQSNPRLWQMHVMLARYATASGDAGEARRHWEAALAIEPGLKEARRALTRP